MATRPSAHVVWKCVYHVCVCVCVCVCVSGVRVCVCVNTCVCVRGYASYHVRLIIITLLAATVASVLASRSTFSSVAAVMRLEMPP